MVPERLSKLDPFADKLAGWLKTEAWRSRKQRRTLNMPTWWRSALLAPMVGSPLSPVSGGQSSKTTGCGIFVPLSFRPGEAFQFDWSEDYAVIAASKRSFRSHEMHFDAHWHGFRVFGCVPDRSIYYNMKTAVDRVGRGKERQVKIRFLAMTKHYVFAPARIRTTAEHVFARPKDKMKLFIRTIGIGRAKVKIGMASIAYNMLRYVFHEGRRATA